MYGILNPKDSVQTIRLAWAYQTQGDAIVYGKENDLSVYNAQVMLIRDDSQTIVLYPDTLQKEPGSFYPTQVVYRTKERIYAGRTYTLIVRAIDPKDGTLVEVTGQCQVPSTPYIIQPDTVEALGGNLQSHPRIPFEKDYIVGFTAYRQRSGEPKAPGVAFELRIYFAYYAKDNNNNIVARDTLVYKTRFPFSGEEVVCRYDKCYRIPEKSFIQYLKSQFINPQWRYYYDDSNDGKDVRLEITAMDSELYKFLLVNVPVTTDITDVKPTYSNLTIRRVYNDGREEQEKGIGIFGAINTHFRYILLSACSQYLAGLSTASAPPDPSCQ